MNLIFNRMPARVAFHYIVSIKKGGETRSVDLYDLVTQGSRPFVLARGVELSEVQVQSSSN